MIANTNTQFAFANADATFYNNTTFSLRNYNDTAACYIFLPPKKEDSKARAFRLGMERAKRQWKSLAFQSPKSFGVPLQRIPLVRPRQTLSKAFVARTAFQRKRKMIKRFSHL